MDARKVIGTGSRVRVPLGRWTTDVCRAPCRYPHRDAARRDMAPTPPRSRSPEACRPISTPWAAPHVEIYAVDRPLEFRLRRFRQTLLPISCVLSPPAGRPGSRQGGYSASSSSSAHGAASARSAFRGPLTGAHRPRHTTPPRRRGGLPGGLMGRLGIGDLTSTASFGGPHGTSRRHRGQFDRDRPRISC